MSELVRRPYKVEDYAMIPFRREERDDAKIDPNELVVSAAETEKYAYTWLWYGVPVACGGIYQLWPGVGEAWFHCSDDIPKHAGVAKDVLRTFDELCAELKLRRAQCRAVVGFPAAHMLIAYLGFQPEVLLRKYGPDGEDYIQYAMFFGDGE